MVVMAMAMVVNGFHFHVATPTARPSTLRRMASTMESPSSVSTEDDSVEEDFEINYAKDHVLTNKARWTKKTKQVATLGPASSDREMIEKLFLAGADVFRLNCSHGTGEEKTKLVKIIRDIEAEYNHPICILADLQGPKLRVGVFDKDKVILKSGQNFRFDMNSDEPGDAGRVCLPHPEIIETLGVGDVLLLDDGKLRMTVTSKGDDWVDCFVDVGGSLSNRKGVNTPTVTLPISAMTPKDREDLAYVLEIEGGIDVVALSFVQKPEDIEELKSFVQGRASVLAKIEKPQAMANLLEIVKKSDSIMVARGDLGVEMNPEDVPIAQKEIISICRKLGKPVIVATQMLESMIENPTPTRAEASDVATAIYDGADAIMLSAESAAGQWPVESVTMQQKIISRVEGDPVYRRMVKMDFPNTDKSATDALTQAAKNVATTLEAAAIVTFTRSGSTSLRAAMLRPEMPIMGVTPRIETARGLALTWGVYPAVVNPDDFQKAAVVSQAILFRKMLELSCKIALEKGIAPDPSSILVVTAGLPFGTPGIANILRILPAAGPDIWDPASSMSGEDVDETIINYDEDEL